MFLTKAIMIVITFFVAVSVHELGHYLAARYYGFRTKLNLSRAPMIVMIEVDEDMDKKQRRIVGAGGFLSLIPLIIFLFLGFDTRTIVIEIEWFCSYSFFEVVLFEPDIPINLREVRRYLALTSFIMSFYISLFTETYFDPPLLSNIPTAFLYGFAMMGVCSMMMSRRMKMEG